MTPLRFRAWHKAHEEMFGVAGLRWNEHAEIVDVASDHALDYDHDNGGYWNFDLDAVVLMQSTGLFDRNKVEIFEGDIFSADQSIVASDDPSGGSLRLVTWSESYSCFQAAYINGNKASGGYVFCQKNASKLFEVIGNVWQNPDLLPKAQ